MSHTHLGNSMRHIANSSDSAWTMQDSAFEATEGDSTISALLDKHCVMVLVNHHDGPGGWSWCIVMVLVNGSTESNSRYSEDHCK